MQITIYNTVNLKFKANHNYMTVGGWEQKFLKQLLERKHFD